MTKDFVLQGRRLRDSDLEWIRGLMTGHPDWNRTRLSREICRSWQWHDDLGRPKDMACRTMLLKLHHRWIPAIIDEAMTETLCSSAFHKLREEAQESPECYKTLGFTPLIERILFRAA